MKLLVARLVIGPFLLMSAPAFAASLSRAAVQMAAAGDAAKDRDSYVQKVQAEIQEWRQKVEAFDKKADAKAQAVGETAKQDLHTAWTRTEAESHKLSGASADAWEDAKRSFETMSQSLKDTWRRVNSDAK
jgi:Skp family chaperone for outer membrane proteins